MGKDLRQASRVAWSSTKENLAIEDINCGTMLRIADALETVAKNYTALQSDRDYWRNRYENMKCDFERERRSAISLRGVITKLKEVKAAEGGE